MRRISSTAITTSPAPKMITAGSVSAVPSINCPSSIRMIWPFFSPSVAMNSPRPAAIAFFIEGLIEFNSDLRKFVKETARNNTPESSTTPRAACHTSGVPIAIPVAAAQPHSTLNTKKKFDPMPGASPIG